MSEPAVQNTPLSNDQKVILMGIQRKILSRQVQIGGINQEILGLEKQLQQELNVITVANNISPNAQLDEDLNILLK